MVSLGPAAVAAPAVMYLFYKFLDFAKKQKEEWGNKLRENRKI